MPAATRRDRKEAGRDSAKGGVAKKRTEHMASPLRKKATAKLLRDKGKVRFFLPRAQFAKMSGAAVGCDVCGKRLR